MMLIKGSALCDRLQNEVLRIFVNRFTKDHRPVWAANPMPNGRAYPVQYASDVDWLDNTYFWITVKGKLAIKPSNCESTPTWPDNPELRK